ncbi:MAG: hypothetical protein JO127_18865 [Caulobacteraceae bacterium]|nr:hypothetical protein [Caulobacteraceae bacterium]
MAFPLDTALLLAGLRGGAVGCVSFFAWLTALELRPLAQAGKWRASLRPGLTAGVGVWALPFLSIHWSAPPGFCPLFTALALPIAIFGAACGFAVESAFDDARGLLAGAALLGGAIAIGDAMTSAGRMWLSGREVDDMPFAVGVALASSLSAAALFALRRAPEPVGRLWAVMLLTVAAEVVQATDAWARKFTAGPMSGPICRLPALPGEAMAPIAAAILILVVLAVRKWLIYDPRHHRVGLA